jgi:formimidoylglutamate deiminase
MQVYHAAHALLPEGVQASVRIAIDGGAIQTVEAGAAAQAGDEPIKGLVLPGMANVHSHAFQRAMAGLTEWDAKGQDNFWSWREAMYRFAERLDPDSQEVIARFLYIEMLKAGYTSVGEFHYLHNQPGGAPYMRACAMANAIAAAAETSGIAMTLLPTLYVSAAADGRALTARQKRFGNKVDQLLKLRESMRGKPGVTNLGLALHSLRAVPPALMREAITGVEDTSPIHVHAAEQTGEVEECVRFLGARPVEYLLENLGVDGRWCLVHSTHMTAEEAQALAQSGAVAGLCPTTESNLGDGTFLLPDYLAAGGRIAIGGDSHVAVDPAAELKTLEYSQRLAYRRRNVAASAEAPHTAARLWADAARNGAAALGLGDGKIAAGSRADLVVIDTDHLSLTSRDGLQVIDSYVFVAGKDAVRDVIVGGTKLIEDGRHAHDERAADDYRRTIRNILGA